MLNERRLVSVVPVMLLNNLLMRGVCHHLILLAIDEKAGIFTGTLPCLRVLYCYFVPVRPFPSKYTGDMMLTDSKARNARLKKGNKVTKLSDSNGLYLEIREKGQGRRVRLVKLWRYRFRFDGRETTISFGEYPSVSLENAREQRRWARGLVKEGVHPSKQRKKEKRERIEAQKTTFQAVSEQYMENYRLQVMERTYIKLDNLLRRDVYPLIGDTPVADLQTRHIKRVLDTMMDRPTMANVAKQNIAKTLDLAIIESHIAINPATPLRNHVKLSEAQHKRPLKPTEITELFEKLQGKEPIVTLIAFELMFLTLVRTIELIEAEWSEFNLEEKLWVVPANRMKKREEYRVPLSLRVIELLKKLRVINGHREHLFPNRDEPRNPAGKGWLNRILKRHGYDDFSPHAIRTTGSTLLNEMGYRPDIIESQLDHRERNLTRRSYNRTDYLEERREMMLEWATYLRAVISGQTDNVVSLHKRRA